jgi:PPE-repeat protein
MDYGALPPEINSAQMYAGPGSGSFFAAAAAWQGLAAELNVVGGGFEGVVSALIAAPWLGPSSLSMLAASIPYTTWVFATAEQAEQASIQAAQMGMAFDAAFAATIPPPAIEANRDTLMTLIATNFFGVNSAAIAATEAEYNEMWAQDAGTMYGYAANVAAAAAALVPFTPALPNTDPAGWAAQAGAVGASAGQSAGQAAANTGQATSNLGAMSTGMGNAAPMLSAGTQAAGLIPHLAGSLANPMSGLTQAAGPAGQLLSPFQQLMTQFMTTMGPVVQGVTPALNGLGSSLSSLNSLGVLSSVPRPPVGVGGMPFATMGESGSLPTTKLSVPSSWAESRTEARIVTALGPAPVEAAPEGAVGVPPRSPGMVPAMAGAQSGGGGPSFYSNADMRGSLGYPVGDPRRSKALASERNAWGEQGPWN